VCGIVLQCFSVWCSVLQSVAVCLTVRANIESGCVERMASAGVLQCGAVCCSVCSVLQCVQCVSECCSVFAKSRAQTGIGPRRTQRFGRCVAVCCSVLQCVAVRCSVLQCVAVRCSVF